jgi:hypothetical protein
VHDGTPTEVLDGLAGDPTVCAATDLIVQAHPVDPPAGEVLEPIELIAGDVAPALGWRSPTSARP